jgi:uncharacterized protein (TIGR00251 family)
MINFTEKNGSLIFTVRVVPRASKTELVGEHDGTLKIRLAAPPVDDAANEELIKFLAKIFAVTKSEVEIISGQTAKVKQIRIQNTTKPKIAEVLSLK